MLLKFKYWARLLNFLCKLGATVYGEALKMYLFKMPLTSFVENSLLSENIGRLFLFGNYIFRANMSLWCHRLSIIKLSARRRYLVYCSLFPKIIGRHFLFL